MRHWVVAGLFILSLITYIDRAAISSAKDAMSSDLGLNNQQMGAVFSSFALGYALAQVPCGWLADRFGPRLLLSAVVVVWSLLTALTGASTGFVVLLIVRFAFGVGEAGAYPGSARAFFNWLPAGEHGRANGLIFAGARIGAAFAFPVMTWLLTNWGWRQSFYLLALPGLVWGVAWFLLFRDMPPIPPPRESHRNKEGASFGEIFRLGKMPLVMAQYFAVNFTTFLCLTWMLPYLKQRYSLSSEDAALYAMIPLLLGATAQWATGTIVDRLYRSGRRDWSRRLPAMLGFTVSAIGVGALTVAPDVRTAVICFTIAAFGAEMTISPSWAFCMDIGGPKSGAITGTMNMLGNIGSFASANLFPLLSNESGATPYFVLVLCLNLMSAAFWYFLKPAPAAG